MQHMVRRLLGLATVAGLSFGALARLVPTGDYVQDGLVARWDGIDNAGLGLPHDDTATVWKDLVGTRDLPLVEGNAAFAENALQCLKRTSGYSAGPIASTCTDYQTIEVVCDRASGNYEFVFNSGAANRIFSFTKAKVQGVDGGSAYVTATNRTTWTFTYSGNSISAAYENGTAITANGTDKWQSGNDVLAIGNTPGYAPNGYPYCGRVYAIRLYDRVLDADEIAYNCAVDQARFFDNPGPLKKCFFSIQPIENQVFTGAAIMPDVQVSFIGTDPATPLTKDRDYEVDYADNDAPGQGKVIVTGKGDYAGYRQVGEFLIAGVVYAKGDALDTGSGASWADAMTWTNALRCAVTSDVPCEIWMAGNVALAANTSYSFTKWPVTIRGGFAGTETRPDQRAAGAESVIDAANTYAYCLNLSNGASAPVMIERINFYRGRVRSLTRSGAGDFTLVDCKMGMRTKARNGDTNGHLYDGNYNAGRHQGGGGGSFTGSGTAVLTVSNCVFYGNTANGEYCASGCGAWVGGFARADFVGTSFTSNNWVYSRSEAYATAIQLYGQKNATFRGCDFRGNYGQGQIVHLEGNCNGAVFDHCVFAGNECSGSALLMANLDAAASTIAVTNCTFAYNYVTGGGAVVAAKGTLTVANSIFHRNLANPTCTKGVDVAVTSADASAALAYCALNGQGKDYVSSAGDEPEKVALLTVVDPMFVTSTDAFMSKLKVTSAPYASYTPAYHRYADFDLHLLSSVGYFSNDGVERVAEGVYSPAIDKGDPDADCSLEPPPNGNRLNLGAYGGTAKASKTAVASPAVDTESFAVAYPFGYSQPTVSFTMAGEGVYARNVVVTVLTNGAVACVSDLMSGLTNGQEVAWLVPEYFIPGSALTMSVAIEDVDAPFVSAPDEVRGELPPWYLKGGGANVVHVRPGATCKGDGSSWSDAFPTLRDGLACLASDPAKTELWIAGTNVMDRTVATYALTKACAIRGGFDGHENAASDRLPGVETVLDGKGAYGILQFSNTDAVEVERLVITRASDCGLYKGASNGDLTLRDCRFVRNCLAGKWGTSGNSSDWSTGGGGARLNGNGTANLTIVNCDFLGNTTKTDNDCNGGGGLFIGKFRSAAVDGCLFATNYPNCGRGGGFGAAVHVHATPVAFANCAFRGNSTGAGDACTVSLYQGCGGSAFVNCLFAGNQAANANGRGIVYVGMGGTADVVRVENCTFAYNVCTGKGALNVAAGSAEVVNSIFFGNLTPAADLLPSDIRVASGAAARVRYCMFTEDSDRSFAAEEEDALDIDRTTCLFGDPFLVTSADDFKAAFRCTSLNKGSYTWPGYAVAAGLDVHLLSVEAYYDATGGVHKADVISRAIDAGDPDSPYDREPGLNGGRINLGAYGNTPFGSQTPRSQVEIAEGSLGVTFLGGYSQPVIAFTAAGEGSYSATAAIRVSTDGGATWAWTSDDITGVTNGQRVVWAVPNYFEPTDRLTVLAEIRTTRASDSATLADVPVEGEQPPWQGKKGPENVIHVRAGATGKGDGSSWTDAFADFHAAVAALNAARNEIWIAGDPAIPVTSADFTLAHGFKIRGGFAGVECDAAERAPGARSVLDGGNERDPLKFTNAAEAELENLVFTHGIYYGLRKKGAGDLTVTNCAFVANGCQSWLNEGQVNYKSSTVDDGGAGACFKGSASSTKLKVVDCVFAGNLTKDNCEYVACGLGAYCGSMKEAVFDSCLFVTNNNRCYRGGRPNALTVYNSKAEVRNCEFRGNNNGLSGGTLYFTGSCGGSRVDHCLFAGNLAQNDGVVSFDLSSATATVTVDHCSIAYNLAGNGTGLRIGKGTMIVRNSIIRDNPSARSVDRGVDVCAGADGKAIVSYSVFGGTTTDYLFGNVVPKEGVITLEPKFVTSADDFVSLYKVTGLPTGSGTLPAFDKTIDLDLHLLSEKGYLTNGSDVWQTSEGVVSPAIDAGDDHDNYDDEPMPNGNCVNAGRYGGTKSASKSSVVEPKVDGDVSVTFGEYTQPTVSFRAGGEGAYAAKATLALSCNGETVYEALVQGVTNGQLVAFLVPKYFLKTDKLVADVTLEAAGNKAEGSSGEVDVSGELPPWYGRGGDPTRVIHVRTGALGTGDGTSWTDAATWPDALNLAKEWTTPVEIWVATNLITLTLNNSYSYTKAPVTIRGGFTATENAASERPDGLMTVIDAENTITYCLNLSNGADAPVMIERINFYRGRVRSLTRSGAGDFTLVDCKMGMRTKARNGDNNGHLYDGNYGAGRHQGGGGGSFSGSGAAVLTVSNCVFYGNTANGEYCGSGCGAWVGGFARADFIGTSFTSNNWVSSRSEAYATAIQLYGQKNATFRGCEFRGNSGQGQIVHLEGNCTGALFENCVFAGNSCSGNAIIGASLNSDAATLAMTNCTVAYNRATSTAVRMTKGTLSVGNSVFYGNIVNVGTTHGADIFLDTNGRARVDYTLFGGEGTNYVSAVSNDLLAVTHAIFGNPRFVTTTNEFMTLFKVSAIPQSGATFPSWAKAVSLNVHLRGGSGYVDETTGEKVTAYFRGSSPALNAGDHRSDYANEPKPNGHRVNLGAYGNTPWATMSKQGTALIVK